MNRRSFLKSFGVAAATAATGGLSACAGLPGSRLFGGGVARARKTPNIVVILADDFGWGTLGCYGGKHVATPACDRLAHEGRRFTNAYAPGSVCSPTRYGLMTGRYIWRTKIDDSTLR